MIKCALVKSKSLRYQFGEFKQQKVRRKEDAETLYEVKEEENKGKD